MDDGGAIAAAPYPPARPPPARRRPWGAVVTVDTWTDLYSALMPQGLVRSGVVAGLASSIPDARRDPSLAAVTAAAFAGDTAAVRPWAQARSSLSKLGSVTTPVFMA